MRGPVPLARRDPLAPSQTRAQTDWFLSCKPSFHVCRHGVSLRADNRENQKPIIFLIIIKYNVITIMCFTRIAVALLLSLYTVVFIKMSLGFNKGVSHQLFPVLKFHVSPCPLGQLRSHLLSVRVDPQGLGGLR